MGCGDIRAAKTVNSQKNCCQPRLSDPYVLNCISYIHVWLACPSCPLFLRSSSAPSPPRLYITVFARSAGRTPTTMKLTFAVLALLCLSTAVNASSNAAHLKLPLAGLFAGHAAGLLADSNITISGTLQLHSDSELRGASCVAAFEGSSSTFCGGWELELQQQRGEQY